LGTLRFAQPTRSWFSGQYVNTCTISELGSDSDKNAAQRAADTFPRGAWERDPNKTPTQKKGTTNGDAFFR
jgi:hypothetical protein